MRKLALVLATAATLAVAAVGTASPAHARYYRHGYYGYGPGIVGGLVAGAMIAGIASDAYGYGPEYGPGYGYYGGYGVVGPPVVGHGHLAPRSHAHPGGYNNPAYDGSYYFGN